ncbi:MAG: hypothetical protein Q9170_000345 [Blastenia crenularia]
MPFLRIAIALLPCLALSANAQAGPEAFQIYNSTGRLPNGCVDGYSAGHDEVLYNVPYTYNQVLSIIGSFADHTLAPAYNPTADLSIYAPIDITTVTPICDGTSSALNFTIDFCSTNVTAAGEILHSSHVFDATTLQEFLGNETWTGCAGSNATATIPSTPSGTGTGVISTGMGSSISGGANGTSVGGAGAGPTVTPTAFTGAAANTVGGFGTVALGLVALFL